MTRKGREPAPESGLRLDKGSLSPPGQRAPAVGPDPPRGHELEASLASRPGPASGGRDQPPAYFRPLPASFPPPTPPFAPGRICHIIVTHGSSRRAAIS